jgi:NAD(P)-dependent dehydrogenase (short-subunit alcohol dehydrogenase family)
MDAGSLGGVTDNLTGKVAVVTGATSGIGTEIARGLAGLGATVLIGARDEQRGARAATELGATAYPLDVADRSSVAAFAARVAADHPTIDILVNNAGAWFSDRRESPDGVELTFATNVLGPYQLTDALLGPLRAGRGRVVNVVSSIASDYDAEDLQFRRRPYDGFKAYAQSKQALRMLTWAQAADSGITANAVAPGFVRTALNRHASGFRVALINASVRLFGTSPRQGADGVVWVASAAELDGVTGRYFDRRTEKDGGPRDPDAIADLQRRCAELAAATR